MLVALGWVTEGLGCDEGFMLQSLTFCVFFFQTKPTEGQFYSC